MVIAPRSGYFSRIANSRQGFQFPCGNRVRHNQARIMLIEPSPAQLGQTECRHGRGYADVNMAKRDEHGTLILDRQGSILACGGPAARLFGASGVSLLGRRISEFIAGFFLAGNVPSHDATIARCFCASDNWRPFDAMDIEGRRFAVELSMSRVTAHGEQLFVLNLRRPG